VARRVTFAGGGYNRLLASVIARGGTSGDTPSIASSRAVAAYFAPDRADPAVQRRVNQWRHAGFKVLSFAFARDAATQHTPEPFFELGQVIHASRAGRVIPMMLAALRIARYRKTLHGVDLFIGRNLDNGLLALFARWISRSKARFVYEILDVNRACTEPGFLGAFLRTIERWLLDRVDLLVVSSPHFVKCYYQRLLGYRGEWILFENKVPRYFDALQPPQPEIEDLMPSERRRPWRIGWFGYLDDERNWDILRGLAEKLPHDVAIHVRGMPYDGFDMPRFLNDVKRLPNVTYGGPYRNPEDLTEVYNSVDLVWSADCNVPSANSKWLLTNALYEAGYFGKPVLGIASNAVGEFVVLNGTGWGIEEPIQSNLIEFMRQLSPDAYEAKRKTMADRRTTLFVEGDEIERIWEAINRQSMKAASAMADVPTSAPLEEGASDRALIEQPKVLVMGLFPPPVDGQRLITQSVYERLSAAATVKRFDIDRLRMLGQASKPLCALGACAALLSCRSVGYSTLYLAPHSGAGLLFSCLIALIARATGYAITVHYHSYWNIGRRSRLMATFVALCGPKAIHVVLGPPMARDLRQFYPSVQHIVTLSNSVFISPHPPPVPSFGRRRLSIGHLSNLSREKGIAVVLDCMRKLISRGVDVELQLAGPAEDRETHSLITAAGAEFGDRLNYLGRLEADEVRRFYECIDVFLFPTSHKHEAEPLVLIDALAAGVPVIATDRGCIPYLLESEGGLVLPAGRFVDEAINQVAMWARQPEQLAEASRHAIARFRELHRQSQADLHGLIVAMLARD
jgi:succinoglycan biosynthesis protein ExoL